MPRRLPMRPAGQPSWQQADLLLPLMAACEPATLCALAQTNQAVRALADHPGSWRRHLAAALAVPPGALAGARRGGARPSQADFKLCYRGYRVADQLARSAAGRPPRAAADRHALAALNQFLGDSLPAAIAPLAERHGQLVAHLLRRRRIRALRLGGQLSLGLSLGSAAGAAGLLLGCLSGSAAGLRTLGAAVGEEAAGVVVLLLCSVVPLGCVAGMLLGSSHLRASRQLQAHA